MANFPRSPRESQRDHASLASSAKLRRAVVARAASLSGVAETSKSEIPVRTKLAHGKISITSVSKRLKI